MNWFANLLDARKIDAWREEYNHERPHSSLEYLTPVEFRQTRVSLRCGGRVKGLRATQTAESRSAELRELELQLAAPLTAVLAPAPG